MGKQKAKKGSRLCRKARGDEDELPGALLARFETLPVSSPRPRLRFRIVGTLGDLMRSAISYNSGSEYCFVGGVDQSCGIFGPAVWFRRVMVTISVGEDYR